MGTYRTKITDYGYKEKVSVYFSSILYGDNGQDEESSKHRQSYKNMTESEKQKSDERRIRYYKRKTIELTEIAMMNTDLNVVITLTFKRSVTSYDEAINEWQLFLKRLRHSFDFPLKYICVWEYQRERSKKENIEKGGVFHFHTLMNLGFIEHEKLVKIWGNGFVWIDKIPNTDKRENTIRYITKYCTKEVIYRIQHGEDIRGQRFFFTSNNLKKPVETRIEESVNIEDIIFANMENIIRDGAYEIKNESNRTLNHVEYVEYKKT